jgi:hypothetical protein
LLEAIQQCGAFRRFKDGLDEAELQEWYRFREAQYARIAENWLKSNGITYQ